MTNSSTVSSQKALMMMAEHKWITYLPTANIVDGVVDLMLQKDYLSIPFNKSIYASARDDFTARQIPGIAVYRIHKNDNTRLGDWFGDIYLDIFIPIFTDRVDARRAFDDIYETLILLLQDGRFMMKLHDYLVPLPIKSAPFYTAVLDFKATQGSALMEFAQNVRTTTPYVRDLKDIGDVWFGQIIVDYHAGRQKYYQLLQAIGIDFMGDPNRMIYGDMDEFEYNIELKSPDGTESEIIEG